MAEFPHIKKSIEDFIYDQEGNIPRNKVITIGSMMIIFSVFFASNLFAGHRSHSSHSSHRSHSSGGHYSHSSHRSSHSSHGSHNSAPHYSSSNTGVRPGTGSSGIVPSKTVTTNVKSTPVVNVPKHTMPKLDMLNKIMKPDESDIVSLPDLDIDEPQIAAVPVTTALDYITASDIDPKEKV